MITADISKVAETLKEQADLFSCSLEHAWKYYIHDAIKEKFNGDAVINFIRNNKESYTISKELLEKYNKIQINIFNEINEKDNERIELFKIMSNTKEKYDKSAISLRLKYLNEYITKLESKDAILTSFLIDIINENNNRSLNI